MELLNRHLTIAADAITQQAGVIDKYMANEIMGLFNTQLNPAEDHAWHAVLAALTMMDEFAQFYRVLGEPLGALYYRMGIHTGEATLGNVGGEERREFTALGDAVNLAHRLLENAQPGQLVLSAESVRHCQPNLDSAWRRGEDRRARAASSQRAARGRGRVPGRAIRLKGGRRAWIAAKRRRRACWAPPMCFMGWGALSMTWRTCCAPSGICWPSAAWSLPPSRSTTCSTLARTCLTLQADARRKPHRIAAAS